MFEPKSTMKTGYTAEDEIKIVAALEELHASGEKESEFGATINARTFVVVSFAEYDEGVSCGVGLFDPDQPVMVKGKLQSAKIVASASVPSIAALSFAKEVRELASDHVKMALRVQMGAHLFIRDGGMKDEMAELKA